MKFVLSDQTTMIMTETNSYVVFDNDRGELLAVCQREDGFEIIASHKDAQTDPKRRRYYRVSSKGLVDLGPDGKDNPPPAGEKK